MKIIEPSVENITPNKYDIESIYKHIEKCGRTCYKSEDKITEDSYKKFCGNIKNDEHLSVFEHGTVYLKIPTNKYTDECITKYKDNEYSKVVTLAYNSDYTKPKSKDELGVYITTNMRVIIENNWEDDLQYLCEPTEYHEKRYTFKVVCDRAVSHEWVRHRHFSFSQESQRYCAYNKSKFGGEVTFVKPHWYKEEYIYNTTCVWKEVLENTEQYYLFLLDKGVKPQDARAVLPNSCKTELIVTGFKSDWEHFLSLRSSKAGATGAHPDIVYLANQVYDYLN